MTQVKSIVPLIERVDNRSSTTEGSTALRQTHLFM